MSKDGTTGRIPSRNLEKYTIGPAVPNVCKDDSSAAVRMRPSSRFYLGQQALAQRTSCPDECRRISGPTSVTRKSIRSARSTVFAEEIELA
jgi:hypothetical protein